MQEKIVLDNIYLPSTDVVAREVHGEFVIIPITSGVGDLEEAIFTLNETGKAIWDRLDGKKTLKEIAKDLLLGFKAPVADIEKDLLGLTQELLKRRIIVRAK